MKLGTNVKRRSRQELFSLWASACSAFLPPLHAGGFKASRYAALIREVCLGRGKGRNANGPAPEGAVAAMPRLAGLGWTGTMEIGSAQPCLVPGGFN